MCNGWHIRLNNKAYKKAEKSSVLIQLSGWLRTLDMVRVTGLEPVRRSTHAPQTCLSAYSSTLANTIFSRCLTTPNYYITCRAICQGLFRIFLCILFIKVQPQSAKRCFGHKLLPYARCLF